MLCQAAYLHVVLPDASTDKIDTQPHAPTHLLHQQNRSPCAGHRGEACALVGGLELDGHPGAGAGIAERPVALHDTLPEGRVVGLRSQLRAVGIKVGRLGRAMGMGGG